MPTFLAIALVLGVGLFVGAKMNSARDAHTHFASYRNRTARGFVTWMRSAVLAAFGIAAILLLLFTLLFVVRIA